MAAQGTYRASDAEKGLFYKQIQCESSCTFVAIFGLDPAFAQHSQMHVFCFEVFVLTPNNSQGGDDRKMDLE